MLERFNILSYEFYSFSGADEDELNSVGCAQHVGSLNKKESYMRDVSNNFEINLVITLESWNNKFLIGVYLDNIVASKLKKNLVGGSFLNKQMFTLDSECGMWVNEH